MGTVKNLLLVYNPFSGDRSIVKHLDTLVETFENGGYRVVVHRLASAESIEGLFHGSFVFDAVCVCGGDGTINIVLNALQKNGLDIPIGIIPCGTANDFAAFLELPRDYAAAAERIVAGEMMRTDLGRANGAFFINVCAGGAMANVSQSVDAGLKSNLGKFAYYVRGLGELQNLKPINLRIRVNGKSIEQDCFMFLVLNSAGTGGFRDISVNSSIVDGCFEFIGIKTCPLTDLAVLFLIMLTRPKDFIKDKNVLYIRSDNFRIEEKNSAERTITDVDGETGPALPVEIQVLPRKQRFFV